MKMKAVAALRLLMVIGLCGYARSEEQITCTRSGPLCKDCHTLGFCIDRGNGNLEFDRAREERCGYGSVCDELTKKCTYNGTCRYKDFRCSSEEDVLIPSPYSCRGYYSCAEQRMNFCKEGEYYDWNVKECRLPAEREDCEGYPIVCSEHGEMKEIGDFQYKCELDDNEKSFRVLYPRLIEERGSISSDFTCTVEGNFEDPGNCTLFYRCVLINGIFQLQHLPCRKGSYFDPSKKSCVRGICQTTTTSTTSTTPTTTTTTQSTPGTTTSSVTTTPSTQPTQKTPAPFACIHEGNFPDPLNCTMFYRCVGNGDGFNIYHISCRKGSYFDPTTHACVRGECQTSTTSTTSTTPSTTTSTTPTTTTSTTPTTTTSTTTPTTPSPTTTPTAPSTPSTPPPPCELGHTYENPDDCKSFYVCLATDDGPDLVPFSCSPGEHFDPDQSMCVAGDTC